LGSIAWFGLRIRRPPQQHWPLSSLHDGSSLIGHFPKGEHPDSSQVQPHQGFERPPLESDPHSGPLSGHLAGSGDHGSNAAGPRPWLALAARIAGESRGLYSRSGLNQVKFFYVQSD
jgi:hypothetical protein